MTAMKLPKAAFILPYATLIAIGFSLYGAAYLALQVRDEMRVPTLLGSFFGGLVAVAILSGAVASLRPSVASAARTAFTPSLLFSAGFGFFLLVERDLTRLTVAAVVMGLIGAYQLVIEGSHDATPRYGAQDVAHLTLALHVASIFFGTALLLDMPSFTGWHPAWAAIVAALVIGAVALETFRHDGFAFARAWPAAAAFAVLGGEFHLALSFLPVLPIVSAACMAILLVTALNGGSLALKGAKPPPLQLYLAASLIAVLLATARWN